MASCTVVCCGGEQQQQQVAQARSQAPLRSYCLAYVACGLLGGTSYSVLLWMLNDATGCFSSDELLEIVTQVPHSRLLFVGGLVILVALAAASYQYSSLSRAHCFFIAVGAAVCFSLMVYDPLHFLLSATAALGISLFQDSWATLGPSAVVSRATKFVFFIGSAVIWGGNVWLVTHLCARYLLLNFSGLILCCLVSPAVVLLSSQGLSYGGVAYKDSSTASEGCPLKESLLAPSVCVVV